MARSADRPVVYAAMAFAALASGILGQYWLVVSFNPVRAAIGWGLAAVLFVILYALDPADRELPAMTDGLSPRVEWSLALLVFAVGIFYRLFRLSELPPGLNHDVAWNGLYAVKILQGEPYTPYVAAAWGRETFMFYLQALGIKWFGMNLFAMIFPAIVAMILMLPLFYFWARAMFGARAALVATFLLAAAGWPLIFGRVGWRAGLQPLFTTVTCLFFWRGVMKARVLDFALSGIGLAVTLNTYNGSRTLPLLFPLFAIAYLIKQRQVLAMVRRYWVGVLVMLATFVVFVAPLAWYAVHNWSTFQGRADALYAGPDQIWQSLRSAFLLFNYRGNGDDFFIDTPLLELPVAVMFVFGVLWCVLRWRDERAVFLLLGLVVSLLPGMVTKPNGNRCIGTMPFAYFFAALGLLYFVQTMRRLGRAGGALAAALLVLGLSAQAGATYKEYLSHDRRAIWGYYPETTVLGRYMRTLVGKYAMWVGGANFPRDSLTFLSYPGQGDPFQRQYTWLDDITVLLRMVLQPQPGRGLAFILATVDNGPAVFAQLQRRFPVHQVVDLHYPPQGGPVFARALLVPADQVGHQAAVAAAPPSGEPLWSGGHGFNPGQFDTPKGLARGPQGDFYVADTGNNRIQKFDAKGAFVAAWGQLGDGPGSFREPTAIAVDPDGDLHVVDTWNSRVQKLSPDGRVLRIYAPPKGFFGPRGITIAKDRVYVTDGGKNLVDVFDLNGSFLAQFGGEGHGTGQLFQPVGIAADAEDRIWVVDSGNNRLQAFHPDGTPAGVVPVPDWDGDQIKEGYLVRTGGGVILSDPIRNRLFLLQGEQLQAIDAGVSLEGPSGLAWGDPVLYVSERGRNAVARVPLRLGDDAAGAAARGRQETQQTGKKRRSPSPRRRKGS